MQDAKTTIANTQFAKVGLISALTSAVFVQRVQDRGIDVAKLDEWEQQIQEQASAAV